MNRQQLTAQSHRQVPVADLPQGPHLLKDPKFGSAITIQTHHAPCRMIKMKLRM